MIYREVLGSGPFRRLLTGLGVSYLGDGLSIVTVAWMAIGLTTPGQAGTLIGASVAAYALPAAFGAAVLARWLSNVDARRLVIANSLLRATMLGAAAGLDLLGRLTPAGYVTLLAISSLLAAWGSAGTYTLVSQIFPATQRLAANALISTIQTTTIIGGPVLAGILVTICAPRLVLAVDALSYLALALLVPRVKAATAGARPGAGFRLLRRRPDLLGLLGVTAVFFFLYGPVEVALPLFAGEADLLGAYWAVFGIGALIGGLAGGLLGRTRPWPFTVAVIAGWGLSLAPFGLTGSILVTMTALAVGGVIYGPFPAFTLTLVQNATDPADQPAVLAARSAIIAAAAPIGAAFGGPLVSHLGADRTLLVSGLSTVALAAAVLIALVLTRAAQTRTAPHIQTHDQQSATRPGIPVERR